MANKGTDKPVETSAPKAPKTETSTSEVRYERDRLTGTDARAITGYPRHIVVGALSGVNGASFTVEQVKNACEKFLNRKVEEA